MTTRILADVAASITELKANPMKVATSAYGEPVAVLNRNEPAFYCVPAEAYEMMMDRLEDLELLANAKKRASEQGISVNIDDSTLKRAHSKSGKSLAQRFNNNLRKS